MFSAHALCEGGSTRAHKSGDLYANCSKSEYGEPACIYSRPVARPWALFCHEVDIQGNMWAFPALHAGFLQIVEFHICCTLALVWWNIAVYISNHSFSSPIEWAVNIINDCCNKHIQAQMQLSGGPQLPDSIEPPWLRACTVHWPFFCLVCGLVTH
jgi:hypothetical protein